MSGIDTLRLAIAGQIARMPKDRYGEIKQAEERAMGKQPFDGRYEWMGDHPDNIKGHDPDVHQVALRLRGMIREAYPINEVPTEVVRLLHDCESSCRIAEERVKLLIETVSSDLKPETVGSQYHRLPAGKAGNCPMCRKPINSITRSERWLTGSMYHYLPCGCTRDYIM